MIRLWVFRLLCFISLVVVSAPACQLIDKQATAWTMTEVNSDLFSQGKSVVQTILLEEGRRTYHVDLLVLHNNRTEVMSMVLEAQLESLSGEVIYQEDILVPFAEEPGVWTAFGLVSHEVNLSLPRPVYVAKPGLYRLIFRPEGKQSIRGITLIGSKFVAEREAQ